MQTKRFNIEEYLKNVFLFKDLTPTEIKRISRHCSTRMVKKNETIFSQGDKALSFYILAYGKMAIFRLSKKGSEQILHFHSDGETIAEAAIFDKKIYPASCKALKESLVVIIPKIHFLELLKDNHNITLKILASYSKRLREFVSMIESLALDDVKMRILKYLKKNHSKAEGWIELKSTKKEIAGILGITPETFSRTFKKLKEDSVIFEDGKKIIIRDFHK